MQLASVVPLPPLDEHSLLVFWCQILLVLVLARSGGYLLRRLGQPRVIGELLAGVALGPSLLGRVWPDGFEWLFPASERQAGLLLGLAWIGIVFLLGSTGAEIDLAAIGVQGRAAVTTTVGSLLVPLAMGAGVAMLIPTSYVGEGTTRFVFASFFAVAFAISSLPVAARILGDLGILSTPVAQLALGVATANDVVGWLLLGMVTGLSEAGPFSPGALGAALAVVSVLAVVVIRFGPRALDRVADELQRRDGGPAAEASVIAIAIIAVGMATHAIGIEVVIGAFIAGIAIGASKLRRRPGFGAIEVVTNGVFAPLFFAIAGIRVDLSELRSPSVLGLTLAVTGAATVAKVGGSYVGGRLGRLDHRDSLGLGFILNARGALEIVVATVGLSLGVIDTTIYTVIVVMALTTTAIAAPLITWTLRRR